MAKPNCSSPGCERESLSYSHFCGQHTSNGQLKRAINKLTEDDLTDVYWDEVELKKILFKNKHFAAGTFSNIDFYDVKFINCGFSDCDFERAVMTKCVFENCELEKCVFTDVTFQESRFSSCRILDGGFNEINIADESVFIDCDLDSCEFSGGIFSETCSISASRFYNNIFTQVSISRASFVKCQFIESRFSKSTLYDSSFIDCHFNTITHDFKLTGPPILCDFNGTVFINTIIPKNFRIWNNFKQRPVDFYGKTVERLLKVNNPDNLKELALVLQHLESFPQINANLLSLDVKELFRRLAADAGHAGNYEAIGEILSAYGRIPEKFRTQTGFFLPPAEGGQGLQQGQAKLNIRVTLDRWTVSQVSTFLSLMNEMEEVLPEGLAHEIEVIERGSFIIQILGSLKPLLAYFQTILDFKKSGYELKLKDLEIESRKIDLESQRRLKHLEVRKAEQDIEKTDLEIYSQKLELMKKIKDHTGYDHLAYSKSKKGKKAEEIAEIMKQEFPILHLRLEE
ncbi:pentapeptide repeat-containing protein [Pedobacter alluvionis]|uniref:Uncharacterized protein YjbI with pentapeptide repeats n=1 Tax=Pedobacter alluvionis TaxID=475253 RepID=A0A497XN59_9SPHI|nr:pentapeptide repeat-containing protein [Pedobacter alluvionis]RLJ69328.1 uncharacterized protein YjbI with pentapeptide repeats [Pedobacter alluvionis]TFB30298.1 hypothetical protein E3V97_19215 [Pedobacter alluvionis]